MYTKDKSVRITLRLNDDQFNFVKSSADLIGVSPSEFLRIVIHQTMLNNRKDGCRRENENAIFNDII